jgi:hypothetical protein
MAIWQCDFDLVPEQWLITTFGELPSYVPEHMLEKGGWWSIQTLSLDYARQLLSFTTRSAEPWFEKMELYGTSDGDCINVWREDNLTISVRTRIDLRQFNRSFADGLLAFARSQTCQLVTRPGKVIAPQMDDFITALKNSRAYSFLSNPQKYFEELKKNPIKFP